MITTKVYPLLEELRDSSLDYLVNSLIELFDNSNVTPKRINLLLLKKFDHHLVENVHISKDAVLCNYSSDQNKLRYDIYNYDNYPPMVKLDKAISMGLKSGVIYWDRKKKYDKYLEQNDPDKLVENIAEQVRDTKDKRRGIHDYAESQTSYENIEKCKKEKNDILNSDSTTSNTTFR
jgi:hypothetical protein